MGNLGNTYNSKAVRLSDRLLEDIRESRYQAGALLPAENEMAEAYGVSRATMRRALDMLIETGYLVKRSQRGVWVPLATEADGDGLPGDFEAVGDKLALAVVWAGSTNYHNTHIQQGAVEYAKAHRIDLHVHRSTKGHEDALRTLEQLPKLGVEGAIVFPYARGDYGEAIRRLRETGMPLVALRSFSEMNLNTVTADDAGSTQLLTHYLIERHRRPVYCIGSAPKYEDVRERYAAHRQAMTEAGFGELVDSHTYQFGDDDSDPTFWDAEKCWLTSLATAQRLLAESRPPISVLCLNDYIGRAVYEAARRRGLRIGIDVAVAAEGADTPMGRCLAPPLTTVELPSRRIGYTAASLLHRLIVDRTVGPVHIRIPVEVIEGQSA